LPFVDRDAEAQSLTMCVRCQRGFPLDGMTPYISTATPFTFTYLCPTTEMEEHSWDGYLWLCPGCHQRFHGEGHCFDAEDV
jgi:hypothetical protein